MHSPDVISESHLIPISHIIPILYIHSTFHAESASRNRYNGLYILFFLGGFGYAFASKRIRLRGLPIGLRPIRQAVALLPRRAIRATKAPFRGLPPLRGGVSDHATHQSASCGTHNLQNQKKMRLMRAALYYRSSRQQAHISPPMPTEGKGSINREITSDRSEQWLCNTGSLFPQ